LIRRHAIETCLKTGWMGPELSILIQANRFLYVSARVQRVAKAIMQTLGDSPRTLPRVEEIAARRAMFTRVQEAG